jgi:hypothetical protein
LENNNISYIWDLHIFTNELGSLGGMALVNDFTNQEPEREG